MINIEELALSILTKTMVIPEFKSKDGDLNEFLMQEAKDYQEQLLAVTYLLQNPKTGDIVAYFSLLNDTIKFEEDDKKTRNRINRKIPYVKQRNHYPAVKIGRLAV
ncbi:MAG: GNAT family N-acetyltransferase, partial [Prevotella sp.]|nr:GNAT family N-acetyltransferase [Prevotella sp.]